MDIVTTRDGQSFELRPCPSWCTGDHFAPGGVIDADDGFHHASRTIRIETADIADLFKGMSIVVEMWLKAWVCPLDAAPGPTQISLNVDSGAVDLTPDEARRISEVLIRLSAQISSDADG
ncbi:hypothetical protein [Actinoallomurus sp. NPDC050550]|uniref:DUF6907 domain-containing protein n=1 Tax=Actinoallomurus sp. NPDC050550 TaxID=3154937 RepID=UPI0033FD9507